MSSRRKHRAVPHINHERWMVSFADFMTLLFALFVVLFAISQVDAKKLQEVSESMEQAFGVTKGSTSVLPSKPTPAVAIIPPIVTQQQLKAMEALKVKLEAQLEKEQLKESVNIQIQERGLVISLRDAAFFDSGAADLRSSVLPKLGRFLRQLEGVPNDMRIEGHTDSQPIHSSQFPSNWELSGARAGSLLRFTSGHTTIRQRQLSIAGYADQRPIADNKADEGRQRNRRVDIVILTDSASKDEPLRKLFGQQPNAERTSTEAAPAPVSTERQDNGNQHQ
ncbi:MAG: OmpA family protein [Candidatus Sericytochromatia bacterium]|nr:OmpA family protein [Candidatus Sericytochromatia bacterium]